ncbi:MAG: hypothetical protein L3J35_11775 [Bacteroidales bacterium]|nr:hypothetical protein [Bacteroidales bacterium]
MKKSKLLNVMKRTILIITIFLIFSASTFSQEEEKQKKYSLGGYITNMQSVMIFDSIEGNWINDNLIHNRLNFNWFPNEHFTIKVGARTRLFSGETVKYTPDYGKNMQKDNGIIDLNTNIFSGSSFLLNTQIDRASISYEKGNLNITLGRQRINWGRSFVWNPNNIFNSYSFFDFDYPEKPGSDALRIQYYTSATSSAELVIKADSAKKVSTAGLFKFAAGGYDFQIMGGIINEQDYVVGTGWEGNIKSISFKGEASYLHPKNNFNDTTGVLVASTSFSYFFSNSLMLQFEFLYNRQSETASFSNYYNQPLSVKNLSFSEYNIFGNINYPVTPLLNISVSGIYYPGVTGFYIGPSIIYSLSENLDFAFIAQTFRIKDFISPFTLENDLNLSFAFLQLKYNF